LRPVVSSSTTPGASPRARLRTLSRLNAAGVRAMGTDLLVVRVDLDP